MPKLKEAVDHPTHYNLSPSGVECIDVVEHLTFNVGSAMKYLWRAGLKVLAERATPDQARAAHLEDLRKARWYIDREISRLETGKSA